MKLTQADRKDIVVALQSGQNTTAQISNNYGITRNHVTHVYREETGTKLKPFKRLTQSEKEAVVAELKVNKTSINEVAARYGVTPPQISYVYKKRFGRPFKPKPHYVAQLIARLGQENPNRTIIYDIKKHEITVL